MFSITRNKGFHLKFANAYTLSVQFGIGNYCARRYDYHDFSKEQTQEFVECPDAEIAIMDPAGEFVPLVGDSVQGYLNVDQVAQVIALVRTLGSGEESLEELRAYLREVDGREEVGDGIE